MTEQEASKIITLGNMEAFKGELDKAFVRKAVSTTWSALKALRDGGTLTPGRWYRITDYVTTTAQAQTRSAQHPFDIIVRADSTSVLNENAFAALHSGDTYFANSKINAWELKYSLDNDTTRFAWASTSTGKGVIWWMKDEYGNEAPYDFKNIMFARYQITACAKVPNLVNTYGGFADIQSTGTKYPGGATISNTAVYRYTFDFLSGTTSYDLTIRQQSQPKVVCHGNVIAAWFVDGQKKMQLNNIVLGGNGFNNCYGNRFGTNNRNMSFGQNVYGNSFGTDVYYNTIGQSFQYNTIGNDVYNNSIGNNVYYNTIGNAAQGNIFGDEICGVDFAEGFSGKTFEPICINSFGYGYDSWDEGEDEDTGDTTISGVSGVYLSVEYSEQQEVSGHARVTAKHGAAISVLYDSDFTTDSEGLWRIEDLGDTWDAVLPDNEPCSISYEVTWTDTGLKMRKSEIETW